MKQRAVSVLSKTAAVDDVATNKAIGDLRRVLDGRRGPLDGSRLLEDVELTSGVTTRIPHGLGRRLRGWLVVRIDGGAALGFVYDEQSSHTDTDRFLYLRAEGYSPTVSLLVF
jgi:hypothetical protein